VSVGLASGEPPAGKLWVAYCTRRTRVPYGGTTGALLHGECMAAKNGTGTGWWAPAEPSFPEADPSSALGSVLDGITPQGVIMVEWQYTLEYDASRVVLGKPEGDPPAGKVWVAHCLRRLQAETVRSYSYYNDPGFHGPCAAINNGTGWWAYAEDDARYGSPLAGDTPSLILWEAWLYTLQYDSAPLGAIASASDSLDAPFNTTASLQAIIASQQTLMASQQATIAAQQSTIVSLEATTTAAASVQASSCSDQISDVGTTHALPEGMLLVGTNFSRYNVSEDAWSDGMASMFWQRQRFSARVLDGYVYIIGGLASDWASHVLAHSAYHTPDPVRVGVDAFSTDGRPLYQMERIPLAGGPREEFARLPDGWNPAAHASVVADGLLYVLSNPSYDTTSLFVYNGTADVWTLDPHPMVRTYVHGYLKSAVNALSAALVAHGGYLYSIGGCFYGTGGHIAGQLDLADSSTPGCTARSCWEQTSTRSGSPYVERYEPSVGWSSMANMKGLRSDAGAAVLGESIYVCGGYCSYCSAAALATIGYTLPQSTCERYDPAANTWTLVANLPEARSYLLDQLVAYEGHLYTYGTAALWRYSSTSDSWSTLASLPSSLDFTQPVPLLVVAPRELHYAHISQSYGGISGTSGTTSNMFHVQHGTPGSATDTNWWFACSSSAIADYTSNPILRIVWHLDSGPVVDYYRPKCTASSCTSFCDMLHTANTFIWSHDGEHWLVPDDGHGNNFGSSASGWPADVAQVSSREPPYCGQYCGSYFRAGEDRTTLPLWGHAAWGVGCVNANDCGPFDMYLLAP